MNFFVFVLFSYSTIHRRRRRRRSHHHFSRRLVASFLTMTLCGIVNNLSRLHDSENSSLEHVEESENRRENEEHLNEKKNKFLLD